MRKRNIEIAHIDIVRRLDEARNNVLTHGDIKNIFSENKKTWRLPSSMTISAFIGYLLENTKLKTNDFTFPGKTFIRYTWGKASIYTVAASLKKDGYFTHQTAMYFHKLTDLESDTIYLNVEQPPNVTHNRDLAQGRIDMAFSRNARTSNNCATHNGKTIYLLNGMHTGKLNVIRKITKGRALYFTDLERTLIDIVVRPVYSGGIPSVIAAYKNAKEKVSIEKIYKTLRKLNYIYPYHQAIGFILENICGYAIKDVNILKRFGLKYDFYLAHNMKKTKYSPEWRLYYPENI